MVYIFLGYSVSPSLFTVHFICKGYSQSVKGMNVNQKDPFKPKSKKNSAFVAALYIQSAITKANTSPSFISLKLIFF